MKWKFISPELVNKDIFGFNDKVIACKVTKWHCKSDVRGYQNKGWRTYADLTEYDPITDEKLKESTWFMYAAKGE
ncbi:MAG: hypothetical protein NT007_01300 [Candidatus Kapabacteria bacterium]|nr:hypothetical protein [Candidatus Kapabacteria bacterium]